MKHERCPGSEQLTGFESKVVCQHCGVEYLCVRIEGKPDRYRLPKHESRVKVNPKDPWHMTTIDVKGTPELPLVDLDQVYFTIQIPIHDATNEDFIGVLEEAKKSLLLFAKKNKDYGNSFAKGSKKRPASQKCMTRFEDKVARLTNFMDGETLLVLDESVHDSCRDGAIYLYMVAYLLKKEEKENPACI